MRACGWLIFLLGVGWCHAALEIPWFGVVGGGGPASSARLVMDGTIGSLAAGVSRGGPLVLNAGYQAGTCGCVVNLDDLAVVCGAWLADDPAFNLAGPSGINFDDFILFAHYWLGGCPAGWTVK